MLSSEQIDSLKVHLNYGAISVDAEPYVSFVSLFSQVIAPNLTSSTPTQCAFAIGAGHSVVTPDSMTDIVTGARLVIDVADDAETISVRSTTPTTFAAKFAKAHPSNTKVALLSGKERLLMLLHRADQALEAMQDQSVGATAGLQSVDKSDVVWQPRFQVLADRIRHYRTIQQSIATLVRVPVYAAGAAQTTSVY
jgi:hypothetical protein